IITVRAPRPAKAATTRAPNASRATRSAGYRTRSNRLVRAAVALETASHAGAPKLRARALCPRRLYLVMERNAHLIELRLVRARTESLGLRHQHVAGGRIVQHRHFGRA